MRVRVGVGVGVGVRPRVRIKATAKALVQGLPPCGLGLTAFEQVLQRDHVEGEGEQQQQRTQQPSTPCEGEGEGEEGGPGGGIKQVEGGACETGGRRERRGMRGFEVGGEVGGIREESRLGGSIGSRGERRAQGSAVRSCGRAGDRREDGVLQGGR